MVEYNIGLSIDRVDISDLFPAIEFFLAEKKKTHFDTSSKDLCEPIGCGISSRIA